MKYSGHLLGSHDAIAGDTILPHLVFIHDLVTFTHYHFTVTHCHVQRTIFSPEREDELRQLHRNAQNYTDDIRRTSPVCGIFGSDVSRKNGAIPKIFISFNLAFRVNCSRFSNFKNVLKQFSTIRFIWDLTKRIILHS